MTATETEGVPPTLTPSSDQATHAASSTEGFSSRLRRESRAAHADAEADGALLVLLQGDGDLPLYRRLLEQLYFVYAVLESRADEFRADPLVGRFVFAELARLEALGSDLAQMEGADWFRDLQMLATTRCYVQRLAEVDAVGFLAHHYTRYLGDLSGGLAVGGAVRRCFGSSAATSFFTFTEIDKPKLFKDEYRRLLDVTVFTEAQRVQIISETLLAYRYNIDMQAEVLAR